MDRLINQRKEWFSRAFLTAVSAAAGYPVEFRLNDVGGVDATVHDGGVSVDFQLKATSSFCDDETDIAYDLDVRTYDLLRDNVRSAPGYLAVVLIPIAERNWLQQSSKRLLLRHCGYWLDLTGSPSSPNRTKVRVHLPRKNTLSVPHLRGIMKSARRRLTG